MKIPKQINVKTALIFVAIGILLTSLIAYAATPSSTYYISPGIYPGAPSYTVWREGSNYFAKDANGQIDYSGTNASQIIQNSIDAIPLGMGSIYIKAGKHHLTHTILLRTNLTLYGDGATATFFVWNGDVNGTMMLCSDQSVVTLRTFGLVANYNADIALNFTRTTPNTWMHTLIDIDIYHPYLYGLYIYGSDHDTLERVTVSMGSGSGSSSCGIVVDACTNIKLDMCKATNLRAGSTGLKIQYTNNARVYGGQYSYVHLAEDQNVLVEGIDCEAHVTDRAMLIYSVTYGEYGPYTLIGNLFAVEYGAACKALKIAGNATNVLVMGNWFLNVDGTMTEDFEIIDYASYVTVQYNQLEENAWTEGGSTWNITITGNCP